MISLLSTALLGALILLFLMAALAPFESLGWWAGWFGETDLHSGAALGPAASEPEAEGAQHFLIYLSGIGAMDPTAIPREELDWGRMAIRRLPETVVVTDVYPYSVTNTGLQTQRLFSRMWRYLEQRRLQNEYDLLQILINIRNMFQVAISADHRYGPIYNLGVANEIMKALVQRGYRVGSGTPITLVGFSGGGQIALGAATFLKPQLRAPIRIISIGGVMSDDIGIEATDKLYHLFGQLDPLHGLGGVLYAGRWPIFPNTPWNRALEAGTIEYVDMGQMHHNGGTNYFSWTAFTPDGRSHAIATIDKIGELLVGDGLIAPAALREAQLATADEVRAYEEARVAEAQAAREAKAARKRR